MTGLVFDALLCALIVGAALATVVTRETFAAVVFYIAYGLLAAIAWVRLGAVDVALAEAAIGAGLTGVLLVAAGARVARLLRPGHAPAASGEAVAPASRRSTGSRAVRALTALACAGVAALIGHAVLALAPDGAGLNDAVRTRLPDAGVANPVTAVLLNFRAYDTLLESIVLLLALVGVWSLADDRHWGGLPGLRQRALPHGVLASFGRVLPPLGLLVGVYLVWVGASRPGGAFQGGTVVAAVLLLAAMAALLPPPPVASRRLRLVLVAGPAVFVAVGVGALLGGPLLHLPPAWAPWLIATIEAALALSIAVTLALLVAGPPQRGAAE